MDSAALADAQIQSCRVTIAVRGLERSADARALQVALDQTAGVCYAYVSADTEMAYVVYDPARIGPRVLRATVDRAGFQAELPQAR